MQHVIHIFVMVKFVILHTEHLDSSGNYFDLFSGDAQFEFWPGHWLSYFIVFISPSREIPGQYLKLDHIHFHQHTLKLLSIIMLSFDTTVKPTFNIIQFMLVPHSVFCFSEPMSILSVLNFLCLGFLTVWCSNPLLTYKTLNVVSLHIVRYNDSAIKYTINK